MRKTDPKMKALKAVKPAPKKTTAAAYKAAGVDVDAKEAGVMTLKAKIAATHNDRVLSNIGLFGGLYSLKGLDIADPVLVASADGVGTKLKVAIAAGVHDTVGHCLVNHCVNDILVQNARPLFFLDYFAAGRFNQPVLDAVIEGVVKGCRENEMALVGGETAEMPGVYAPEDYDLAGFIVGIADRKKLILGKTIRPDDLLLGLESSGLHTNGYSLARNVLFEKMGLKPADKPESLGGKSVGEALLAVHRSYLKPLQKALDADLIEGLAHITGGGYEGNIPRVLPDDCRARIKRSAFPKPPIFELIASGGIDRDELFRVFNMGIGMVIAVRPENAARCKELLIEAGEKVYDLGVVVKGEKGVEFED